MYGIIALVSACIRQFYLPNPFANIIDPSYADLFNIIIGGVILHILAFIITGCVYDKGSAPAVGSFLYLFNYVIIIGLMLLITIFIKIIWIAVTIFFILYITACILLSNYKSKQYNIYKRVVN